MAAEVITQIVYPLSDTVNSKVNPNILKQELADAGLSIDVLSVSTAGTTFRITLNGNATDGDKLLCDSVVAAHEGAVFSSSWQSASDESETSDDSGSIVDKATLDTGYLPAGSYLLTWYMEMATTNSVGGIRAALRAAKSGNSLSLRAEHNTQLNDWQSMSGSLLFNVKDGDRYDLRLSYIRTGSSDPARVQRARIFLAKQNA